MPLPDDMKNVIRRPELTEFAPLHWESVLALYRRYFGGWSAKRFAARWHWQYETNPYCSERPSFIQVGLCGEEVVAHMGAFPIPLRLGETRCIAMCGADFVIDDRCRWIALQLFKNFVARAPVLGSGVHPAARRIFEQLGGRVLSLSHDRFIYRLGNGGAISRKIRSRLPSPVARLVSPRVIRKLVRSPAVRLASADEPSRHMAELMVLPPLSSAIDIRPIARFDESYDVLWRRASRKFTYSLDKTATYLNWRYVDCPTMKPLCLGLFDEQGELSGVVVAASYVHTDRHGHLCGTDGELLELITDMPPGESLEHLIIAAMRALNRAGVDEVGVTGLRVDYHAVLRKLGFVHQRNDRFGVVLMLEPGHHIESLCSDEASYTTAGDGDALYAIAI